MRRYGVRLLPEMYECFNPMPFEAAAEMEQGLAEDLRAEGYTVTGRPLSVQVDQPVSHPPRGLIDAPPCCAAFRILRLPSHPAMHKTCTVASQPRNFSRITCCRRTRVSLCAWRVGRGAACGTRSGKEYLDFGAGIAVSSLGHAHPRILETLTRQASTLTHTSNLYYTRPQGLLAERIVRLVGHPGKVFFCNSGAEANEGLFKLARKFGHDGRPGGRFEVLTFHDSFHGRTLAGIAATGQEKVKKGFDPVTPGFTKAHFNDLASVEAALTPRTAAILLEPIQGEIGVVPATAEFLRGLRRLCDERDLLLMFDEIQCGFGRTGDWCAWWSLGCPEIVPDAIAWAKGMAAGFPMGAFWVRDRAMTLADGSDSTLPELLGPGSHGTTFGGTPLGCAVSLETLATIEDEGLLANSRREAGSCSPRCKVLASPRSKTVRGVGLMIGVELDPEAVAAMPGFRSTRTAHRVSASWIAARRPVCCWCPPARIGCAGCRP